MCGCRAKGAGANANAMTSKDLLQAMQKLKAQKLNQKTTVVNTSQIAKIQDTRQRNDNIRKKLAEIKANRRKNRRRR